MVMLMVNAAAGRRRTSDAQLVALGDVRDRDEIEQRRRPRIRIRVPPWAGSIKSEVWAARVVEEVKEPCKGGAVWAIWLLYDS